MKIVPYSCVVLFLCLGITCQNPVKNSGDKNYQSSINQLLDEWHRDVARFDFSAYFGKMTKDAVFIGTDASEIWNKEEFMAFSKPYFEKKQTWDFIPISRNIYSEYGKQAWFDELLNTWMGVCRGSGVAIYDGKEWKIQHYVLSVTVPNKDIKEVIAAKKYRDSLFLKKVGF